MEEVKQASVDMGNGSVKKIMIRLMLPAVIAQIVNLLYNIVDRIYIGHMEGVGAIALTGVGLFTPILMIMNAFAMLIGAGATPRFSMALGKKDNKQAEKIMTNSLSMLVILSIILTVVLYILAPSLLTFFGASQETLPYALEYSRIYILGTIFVLIVMGMNNFIAAQGFAKTSMMTTVIGALINIVLDPILMFVFNMGVQGAAIATVFSQAIAALWILHFLSSNKTVISFNKSYIKPQKEIVLPIMELGVSTFVMLITESLLSISFDSSLASYGGDAAVGAMTIITSVSQLCTLPMQGFCQGAQPVMSFNYGAKKNNRVKEAFSFLLKICFSYSLLFWLVVMLVPSKIASIFTTDTSLVTYTVSCMRIYMAGIFAFGIQITCQQSFMALGQAKISFFMACLRKLILLIPLIYILPHLLPDAVLAIFLAEPISDILAGLVTGITFYKTMWKKL